MCTFGRTKVGLAIGDGDGEPAETELTPADARDIARSLVRAADTAERTPGS